MLNILNLTLTPFPIQSMSKIVEIQLSCIPSNNEGVAWPKKSHTMPWRNPKK